MYKVRYGTAETNKNDLFLVGPGACWLEENVKTLLASKGFTENNMEKVPIFQKALKMMENKEVGEVVL